MARKRRRDEDDYDDSPTIHVQGGSVSGGGFGSGLGQGCGIVFGILLAIGVCCAGLLSLGAAGLMFGPEPPKQPPQQGQPQQAQPGQQQRP